MQKISKSMTVWCNNPTRWQRWRTRCSPM